VLTDIAPTEISIVEIKPKNMLDFPLIK